MTKDTILYDRLNIKSNASESEIKKGYRKASLKWHPDKNTNNKEEATLKFQEINEAYSILSDKEKRNLYDQIGIDILKNENMNNDFDPSDIFEQFFGNMNNVGNFGFPFGFSNNDNHQKKKENCIYKLSVTLEQIYNEEKININYNQKIYCKKCNGTGAKSGRKSLCTQCDGKGKVIKVVRMGPMVQQMVSICESCNGQGKKININDICETCNGKTYYVKSKKILIPLKNGLNTGNKIRFERKGHIFKNEKTDLIIEIIQIEHKKFKRNDSDLILEIELKLYQSLIGFDKIIEHLDKRKLHISYRDIIKEGDIKIIKDEGLDNLQNGTKGDLHIIFTVKYPKLKNLSKKDSELLKVLLAKTEEEEVDNETKIISNKSKYLKRKLIDKNINYNSEKENFANNESPPSCTQQ